jgi:hypothetical protein
MDFGKAVGDSFAYAQEGLVGKWTKWILLLVATILLALPLMGYMLKILRGEKPAPEVQDWGTLFVDGIKYLIIAIIYAIPVLIVEFLVIGAAWMNMMSGNYAAMSGAIAGMLLGIVVMIILAVIIALFETIGLVRFARTGSIGEAFNFNAIMATIGKIGWVSYIIALIILFIIVGIIEFICMLIPVIGMLLLFILIPFLVMFGSRYICLLYDSAGA